MGPPERALRSGIAIERVRRSSRKAALRAGFSRSSALRSNPESPRPSFRHKPKHRLFVQAFQLSLKSDSLRLSRQPSFSTRSSMIPVKVRRADGHTAQRSTAPHLALLPLITILSPFTLCFKSPPRFRESSCGKPFGVTRETRRACARPLSPRA